MLALTPKQVAQQPKLCLVDVRPSDERDDGLGFVPGSIGLQPGADLAAFVDAVQGMSRSSPVLLVCTSGERARTWAVDTAAMFSNEVGYLAGGVLRWGAAGLPLCAVRGEVRQPLPMEEFRRRLAACFVAELVDVSLDRELDPLEMLRSCFEQAGVSFDDPTPLQLRRVLDYAAALSRGMGTGLERVAANLDMMMPLLPEPTEPKDRTRPDESGEQVEAAEPADAPPGDQAAAS